LSLILGFPEFEPRFSVDKLAGIRRVRKNEKSYY